MRKKVTLAYITNDQERKLSYKKRKPGFLKKLSAICTLCDVEACCILYAPYETGPVVWPNPEKVHAVLDRLKTISPLEQIKKTVDQEGYNTMRIQKNHDLCYKIQRENQRKILELYMFQVIAGKMTLDCFDIRNAPVMRLVIKQWLTRLEVQLNKLREGASDCAGGGNSHNVATTDGIAISKPMAWVSVAPSMTEGKPDVVAGIANMSEAEADADVAATMEAFTPLIPSLDLSSNLGIYDNNNNFWNDLMFNNDNDAIPNNRASDDGGFALLGDGIAWKDQYTGFDVYNNDGGVDGDDDDEEDGVERYSSGDDDTDEDDGEDGDEEGI